MYGSMVVVPVERVLPRHPLAKVGHGALLVTRNI